jgi:hypothetical protein
LTTVQTIETTGFGVCDGDGRGDEDGLVLLGLGAGAGVALLPFLPFRPLVPGTGVGTYTIDGFEGLFVALAGGFGDIVTITVGAGIGFSMFLPFRADCIYPAIAKNRSRNAIAAMPKRFPSLSVLSATTTAGTASKLCS